jgi:purine-nucleoside phosphorylase
VGLRCIREIGDRRIGVLARFLRSILERNVRLAAHTLEVKGGTPRISDQFPAFDRKRGNAWDHYLQDAVDMASLAITTIDKFFNI